MVKKFAFRHNDKVVSIYCTDKYFSITTDNLMLSNFVNVRHKDKTLVDFGSGLFTIPLLLSCRYNIRMYGIEKEKLACKLSEMTIKANNLNNKLFVINDYIQNVLNHFNANSVDIVVSNPPYFTSYNEAFTSSLKEKETARHEVDISFIDLVVAAKKILKNQGSFFLIQRVERLTEISEVLKNHGFAIKRLQFIHPTVYKKAKLVMVEARKNGGFHGLEIMAPIIIERDGD